MKFIALIFLFSVSPSWIIKGLQNPIVTPAHAIIIVALGLLIAQQQLLFKHLLVLSLAVICGMLSGHFLNLALNAELILLAVALILGLLVVLRIKQVPSVMLIISLCVSLLSGFLLGLDSSPIRIPGLGSNGILNWHLGALVSVISSVLIVSLLAIVLNRFWEGIILRVLGSWVATSALITLVFQLSKIG